MVDPKFHPDSYGYRPGRSALDAVATARKRCWDADWVIDLDIKASLIPSRMSWLSVPWRAIRTCRGSGCTLRGGFVPPCSGRDGTLVERTKGTPQGGVISPLLANLFLHYGFDVWMRREYPHLQFERYADDAIVHCKSERQARVVLDAIRGGTCQ